MNLIIYRSHTDSLIEQQLLPQLVERLPPALRSRAYRYKSEVSAYNYVIGRLLLKRGLEDLGINDDLEKVELQENGKPILSGIHFNISHSGNQVICGFSKDIQLGVDLERIASVDFEDFTSMFSAQEWLAIKGAVEPIRLFYWFWTRKESIIKALGFNLNYLHQIKLDVSCDYFVINEKRWHLREIDVGEGYMGALCSERKIEAIKFIDLNLQLK